MAFNRTEQHEGLAVLVVVVMRFLESDNQYAHFIHEPGDL